MGAPVATRREIDTQQTLAHIALIAIVSCAFESLFIHHGIGWLFDEGWPLYAAMQLHDGGVLYRDVFFLFPPGHLLPAWIAYGIDPPGILLARIFYAAFNVALCVAIYGLGRRLMKPPFALLAALLLAVAAPRSHLVHVLFGYRFLVFSVLALLAFSMRLSTGERRWMGVAGLCAGVALYFRLTPAFAVSCGIAVAVLSADRDWRVWLWDWLAYGLGLAVILAPMLLFFATGAGIDAAWDQAVMRILPLQGAQAKPIPEMLFPSAWDRELIWKWFVSVQYWLYPTLYGGYALALLVSWFRSLRSGKRFEHALLLAVVIWGGVYMLRALGRSDEHHLTTALPPVCLILAHGSSRAFSAGDSAGRGRVSQWVACAVALALWVGLQGSDVYVDRARRGVHPLHALGERVAIPKLAEAQRLNRSVARIQKLAEPGERILDLTYSPLIYVLADRRGPGYGDIVTPGVFDDPEDERRFIARLEDAPPKLVLWPRQPFDRMPTRSIEVYAPQLSKWVHQNYERVGRSERTREIIMKRRN